MKLLAAILLSLPISIWASYVEKTLWWWFVVPLGVRPIGIAQAYGLSALLVCMPGAISRQTRSFRDEEKISSLVKLISGRIAHTLMVRP